MGRDLIPDLPILLVDDEEAALRSMTFVLRTNSIANTVSIADSRQVPAFMAANEVCFVLLDLAMPHVTGHELLTVISRDYPHIPVVIATAVDEVETAVECMKNGASDYICKPLNENRFLSVVRSAIEVRSLRREQELLRSSGFAKGLKHAEVFADIVTQAPVMIDIFKYAEAIAGTGQAAAAGSGPGIFSARLRPPGAHQCPHHRGDQPESRCPQGDRRLSQGSLLSSVRA